MKSYNGWPASEDRSSIGVTPFAAGGVGFPGGVKAGSVTTVLRYVAEQFDARVEPLVDGWCWGHAYRQNRNAENLSTHASGTAIDVNAPRHPNGKRGTFTLAQRHAIKAILAEVAPVVRWGGSFTGTPDEMHLEIAGTPAEVAAVARRITSATPPTSEDDDMTPAQAKQLDEVHAMLEALTAPRLADKSDRDPNAIDLGDLLTKQEKLA